jgi:hypothetical protein
MDNGPWTSFLHEVIVYGIAGKFGIIVQAELVEDAGTVGADRVYAEGDLLGDLGYCFAGCDELKYLHLAV